MNLENKSRWGIVAVGILMLFVTIIITSNKNTSTYALIWLAVSYFGYKGDLFTIRKWMNWLIYINLGLLFFIFVIFDSADVNSKGELGLGVFIMLIPKVLLYFYCDSQLVNSNNNDKPSEKKRNIHAKKSENNIASKFNSIKTKTDDEIWAIVLDEYNSNLRNKSLYSKLYAQLNGDDAKVKANYLSQRFEQLKQQQIAIENENIRINDEYIKIKQTKQTFEKEFAIKNEFYKTDYFKSKALLIFEDNQVAVQKDSQSYNLYENIDDAKRSIIILNASGQRSFLGFVREIDMTKSEKLIDEKIIITCPICRKEMKVPKNKDLEIKCPFCRYAWKEKT